MSKAEVVQAAIIANAHSFITNLPDVSKRYFQALKSILPHIVVFCIEKRYGNFRAMTPWWVIVELSSLEVKSSG